MSEFSELYTKISQIDSKLVRKWQNEVNKRVRRFVRNIAKSSPFLDKPQKRMFGIRNSKDGQSLTIFGSSPNAGRMKAFNAPTDKWQRVRRYFHIYGNKGWRTIHKVQTVRTTAGTEIKDLPYFGTFEQPEKYFGTKKGRVKLAYGKTKSGIALPVYAENSYPDWIMQHHRDEIDNIILETGRSVLNAYILRGGAQ